MSETRNAASPRIPGVGHWVRLFNSRSTPILCTVEPWTVEFKVAPDEECYIYLAEYDGHIAELEFTDDGINVFASLAVVYLGREKLYDFYPRDVGPLPFVAISNGT